MGLDITAYRGLKKLDVLFNAHGEPVDPVTREPVDNYLWARVVDYPLQAVGLEDGAVYSYADAEHVFSRGYIGYGVWREALAKMTGYPAVYADFLTPKYQHAAACWQGAMGPFCELINFSDCEGVIGPTVAAKLAKDFAEWDERAKSVDAPRFYEGYCAIRRGLEIAADGGAVRFG